MNSFFKRIEVSKKLAVGILSIVARPFVACHRGGEASQPDSPQLTPKVTARDVTFYRKALQRNRKGFWDQTSALPRFARSVNSNMYSYDFGGSQLEAIGEIAAEIVSEPRGTSPLRR